MGKYALVLLSLLFLSTAAFAAGPRPACSGNLDVIRFKDSSFEMTGDIISENEQRVVLTPENGGRIELRRELIESIEYDSRPPKQVSTDELVSGFTQCVSRLLGGERIFRIVKTSPEALYLNVGSEQGARPGIELSIYREKEEIVDSDTGASLGKDKDFVGIVQIIFTDSEFSRAVPVDAPAERFREGDIGVYLRQSPVLAIAAVTTAEGEESPYGTMLSEQLLAKFNENPGMRVVERRQISKVLRELAIQNTLISPSNHDIYPSVEKRPAALGPLDLETDESEPQLDSTMAEKLKMIRGADAIVFGTVTDVGGKGAVNLRVVDTSTAAILFSTYKMIGNPEKPITYAAAKGEPGTQAGDRRDTQTRAEPAKGARTDDSDLLDRILRAIYSR